MCSFFLDYNYNHGNIAFNFSFQPIDHLVGFAEGYHEAGKELLKKIENRRGRSDSDGYPIFFLYRHSLELYLKAVIYKGARLVHLVSNKRITDFEKLFRSHGLAKFIPALEMIYKEKGWSLKSNVSNQLSFKIVAEIIREVESVDPTSFRFRYPFDKKGTFLNEKNIVLNVILFARTLDPLLDLLNGIEADLDEDFENVTEIEYEINQILYSGD